MKIKRLMVGCCLALVFNVTLQAQVSTGMEQNENTLYPLHQYQELSDPKPASQSAWLHERPLQISWGSTDVRYRKTYPPTIKDATTIRLKAWRGERVSAQWVAWGTAGIQDLSVQVGALVDDSGMHAIPTSHLHNAFVRYVMTDTLNKNGGGCGYRHDHSQFDSSLVADPLDALVASLNVSPRTTQPGWVTIDVPRNVPAGLYKGILTFSDVNGRLGRLRLEVEVLSHLLPPVEDWTFHLDLWQNPYAVARYYQVPVWSEEHFAALRPYMEMYKNAGGKVITASIMYRPWNAQTFDPFDSMIAWKKLKNGEWQFDYTQFDRWVEFMMNIGITKQINCYSMIPWDLSFQYFDEATNGLQQIKTKPGEPAYDALWQTMLKDFARHLKAKGWFSRTYIAMDERPMKDMKAALKVIKSADPDYKVAFAGNLHPELQSSIDDYCAALSNKYPEEMLFDRMQSRKTTTFYTCCTESRPNTFTFSPPAEAEWMGWYAARQHLDGYLRWALNSWVRQPLLDSRFDTWAAGDTYLIYPGPRSSIRFERLRQGIEAYEKVRILKAELMAKGRMQDMSALDRILNQFDENKLTKTPASVVVREANDFVNRF